MERASIPLTLLGSQKLVYGHASSRYGCKVLRAPDFHVFWLSIVWHWRGGRNTGQCYLCSRIFVFVVPQPLTNPQPHASCLTTYTDHPLSKATALQTLRPFYACREVSSPSSQLCCSVLLQVLLSSISRD